MIVNDLKLQTENTGINSPLSHAETKTLREAPSSIIWFDSEPGVLCVSVNVRRDRIRVGGSGGGGFADE